MVTLMLLRCAYIYQREAERTLYRTLSIRICPNYVKCLTRYSHILRGLEYNEK
jgi:hypothetical protein